MRLLENIARHAQVTPKKIALSDARSIVRYGELPGIIQRLAQQLHDKGITRVALKGDNTVQWALWDLACLEAGVINVPLPAFFSETQTHHVLAQAGIEWLIDADINRVIALQRNSAGLRNHIHAGTTKITFTSGSTGTPKGVCLSARNLDTTTAALAEAVADLNIEQHLCVLPLATLLENVAGIYLPLWLGAEVRLQSQTSLGFNGTGLNLFALLGALNETRPGSIILVPELLTALVKAADMGLPLPDSLHMVAVGGGKVADALLARADQHGIPVYQGYGLSEACSVASLNTASQHRSGTAGRLLSHCQARVDEQQHLWLRGDSLMLGYLGEATDPENNGGWLDTGDLAQLDDDGFVTIRGRSKNLIITSWGRNISPEWVESELTSEMEILQAAVLGDGEQGLGAVLFSLQGVSDRQLAEAISRVNRRLPEYARIHHWLHTSTPFSHACGTLTGNGRLRRDAIETQFAEALAAAHDQPALSGTAPTPSNTSSYQANHPAFSREQHS